ncbi:hypothetical protein DLM20_25415, partial [Salmonella enterica subsp. enterica serovar Java]|nr:hypothetical protein [Salmonella enterica subsp. enterica serovar Java]
MVRKTGRVQQKMRLTKRLSPENIWNALTGRREIAVQAREIAEQQEIIRLLLKDFGSYPSDWIWHTDAQNKLTRVSDRFASATNQAPEFLAGRDFTDFLRFLSDENETIATQIDRDMESRSMFHDVIVKIDRNGEEHWWRLSGKPSFNKGVFAGYLGSAS